MSSKESHSLQLHSTHTTPNLGGSRAPTYVVGVGASPGGLESLEKLFRSNRFIGK